MGDKQVAFGDTETWTPLSPDTNRLTGDALIGNITKGGAGGQATTEYFENVNAVGQLYKQIAQQGESAWEEGQDDNGNPVHTVSMSDEKGEIYYMKLAVEGLNVDGDGKIVPNGNKFTVKGKDYHGMATITHTVGYSNYTFSKTFREAGFAVGGSAIGKIVLPYLWRGVKILAQAIARGVVALWQLATGAGAGVAGGAGSTTETAAVDAAASGEETLIASGVETAGSASVGASGVAAGTVLVGVAIVLAVAFIAISFILHNSYHNVRIWNLTRYHMEWSYWFDSQTSFGIAEGKLISGPGTVDKDDTLKPTRIPGCGVKKIPGVKATPHVSYGDIQVVSSHEFSGIGYTLQLHLRDPKSDQIVHTVTAYYDIPFTGKNSHNVTFDQVNDVGQWYRANSGQNVALWADTASPGNDVWASSSYDFLEGKHAVPAQQGGSSNEAFYYQSLLIVQEPELMVRDFS